MGRLEWLAAIALIASSCAAAPAPAAVVGTDGRTLVVDGVERTYVLHVPDSVDAADPVDLVIDLHGLGLDPEIQADLSGFREKADEEGFVVAHPAAAGEIPTWQAGSADASPDVAFLEDLIADVASRLRIGSVFVAGFSNGAGMAHRFACDSPQSVAAIATVAGAYPDTGPCSEPMPVIAFHGTDDPIVPYGGAGTLLPGVKEWASAWADRAGCGDATGLTWVQDDVTRTDWIGCEDGVMVQVWTIIGGAHGWPGTTSPERTAASTSSVSATDLIWDFFVEVAGGSRSPAGSMLPAE